LISPPVENGNFTRNANMTQAIRAVRRETISKMTVSFPIALASAFQQLSRQVTPKCLRDFPKVLTPFPSRSYPRSLRREPLKIVCGAPNVAQGQNGLPCKDRRRSWRGFVIKKSKIRGEVSEGMICSERELGLSENHEGIWVLPADSVVGMPLAKAIGKDDVIFEIVSRRTARIA